MIHLPSDLRILALLGPLALLLASGCQSPMARIDREVQSLVADSTETVGARTAPRPEAAGSDRQEADAGISITSPEPPTVNPAAEELRFHAVGQADAQAVIDRLEAYSQIPDDVIHMELPAALAYAMRNSREYRFAEEDYILSALRLLIERHRWGPRFFNEMSAFVNSSGDDGTFDSSLSLVNDLSVTQRLPYGGEVSARALASATEDLHQRVAGENVQSASIILSANVPLLRGAGMVARESLIQAERNLIYAARDFERFRREFLFNISNDYLDLVVSQRRIENSRLGVESFRDLESREEALFEAGRSTPYDLGQSRNETFEAVDGLNNAREGYRLSLDRFKVRIGMPLERALVIEPDDVNVPTPETTLDEAVVCAMSYRLDLQTRRDQVDDARRDVDVARNNLLGDLDLSASATLPTDSDMQRSGLQFEPGSSDLRAGITYSMPLDRRIEQLNLREAQIALERSQRDFERFRDDVALNVRAAVRGIDSAMFSLQIQNENVRIAELREAAIAADPARATTRDKTEAINQTSRARDARDASRRDLEVAVLGYLLATGQLRADVDGSIARLPGMEDAPVNEAIETADDEIADEENVP